MSKKKKILSFSKILGLLMGIMGILTTMGLLGFTGIGKAVYNFMKIPLGKGAWLAPLIFLFLTLIFWLAPGFLVPVQKNRTKQRRKPRTQKKIPSEKTLGLSYDDEPDFFNSQSELPKGKLVNLKGFDEYFSDPYDLEPMEELEKMEELGMDFESYFREGREFSIKPLGTRLSNLKGFESYFYEDNQEPEEIQTTYIKEKSEESVNISSSSFEKERLPSDASRAKAWENTYYSSTKGSDYFPGQVSQLINKESTTSIGLSQEERAVLLGKEKPPFNDFTTEVTQEEMAKGKRTKTEIAEEEITIEEIVKKEIAYEEMATKESVNEEIANEEVSNEEVAVALAYDTESAIEEELVGESSSKLPSNALLDSQKQRKKSWVLPSLDLLDPAPQVTINYEQETQKNLEKILEDFGVSAKVIRVARGPVITRYELAPAPGVKISRIVNLADDIALGLAARDVRIEAPIPGKSAIGIEVPNKNPRAVPFREVLETPEFKDGRAKLRFALGIDIGNQSIVANLAKMPHLLVAGATGSGKSVCITGIINSLLFNASPQELKFLMVDPKMVELSIYNGIPHLLAPVVTDPKKASAALKWVVKEMETRYELFAAAGVRDIERYNQVKAQEEGKGEDSPPSLPWIVVVIDELADLMMVAAAEVEEAICRLAQMARAAGIHLVIATQRPSVDVITGLIKANIPSRISFAVSSQIDSRTILDSTGAEKLLGRGDMLYSPQGINKPVRVQGCMVTDDEVERVIQHWKTQGSPEYLDPEKFNSMEQPSNIEGGGADDELFVEAGHLIINTGMASVSYLQRKLKLGYARAARLMDLLEDNGVVGGYEGSKPRQILLTLEEFQERFGSQ